MDTTCQRALCLQDDTSRHGNIWCSTNWRIISPKHPWGCTPLTISSWAITGATVQLDSNRVPKLTHVSDTSADADDGNSAVSVCMERQLSSLCIGYQRDKPKLQQNKRRKTHGWRGVTTVGIGDKLPVRHGIPKLIKLYVRANTKKNVAIDRLHQKLHTIVDYLKWHPSDAKGNKDPRLVAM